MRKFSRSLFAVVAFAMTMCSGDLKHAQEADLKQVREYVYSPMGYYASMFSGVFYAGSDSESDYIAIKHGKSTVKMFKIKRGEIDLKDRTTVQTSDKKWVDITNLFPPPR